MEKKKNKFLDFVLSLFLPRKMVRHANMRFVFALLIVMLVSVLSILTSNARSKKDSEKALDFPADYTELAGIEFSPAIPHVSLVDGEAKGIVYENGAPKELDAKGLHLKSDANGVFKGTKTLENGHTFVVTVVIDDQCFSTQGTAEVPAIVSNFDIDGYCLQKKADNTDYLLYVFTLDAVYYLFNFEQMRDGESTKAAMNSLLFESVSNTELKYYLPFNSDELALNEYGNLDTTKWTKVVKNTDIVDFSLPSEYAGYQDQVVPTIRHLKNIGSALYGDGLSYTNTQSVEFDINNLYGNFNQFQKEYKNLLITISSSTIKFTSLITCAFVTIVFSLLLSFITWIISKNFVLRKFRQYFALAAICFSLGGVLSLILGIFISYLNTWFYILLFQTFYYIVVCFRINTMKPKEDENIDDNNQQNDGRKPLIYEKVEKENKVDSDITSVG